MSGASPRGGMQSMTPDGAVLGVEVGLQHQRVLAVAPLDALHAPAGAICQRPLRASPSSAAKHAGESNRGRHSQSIEPSRPTSAAVCVSPMTA